MSSLISFSMIGSFVRRPKNRRHKELKNRNHPYVNPEDLSYWCWKDCTLTRGAIHTLPDPERVSLSVADPNPQVLADFGTHYPQAHIFDNAQAMLAEPAQDTDIVIVATPPFTHYELTCTALSTGRHVLCEKPLAMDRAQARQMLAMAKEHNRLLGCCSVRFLHWPPAEEARRLLNEHALGEIYHVRFISREQRNRPGVEYQPGTYWFLDSAKSGGGTLMDRAPYEFTMLNELFRPERVEVLGAWTANPTTALHLPPEPSLTLSNRQVQCSAITFRWQDLHDDIRASILHS